MGRSNMPVVIVLLVVVLGLGAKLTGLGPFTPDDAATAPAPVAAAPPAAANAQTAGTTTVKAVKAKKPHPLAALTKNQRRQLIEVESGLRLLGGPSAKRSGRIGAVRKACRNLDTRSELLATLNATCPPQFALLRINSHVEADCDADLVRCVASTRRYANAVVDYVSAASDFTRAAKATIPAGACRTALLPSAKDLRQFKHVAGIAHHMVDALDSMNYRAAMRRTKWLERQAKKLPDTLGASDVRKLRNACRA